VLFDTSCSLPGVLREDELALRTACAVHRILQVCQLRYPSFLSNVNQHLSRVMFGPLAFRLYVTLSLNTVAVRTSWNPIAQLSAAKLKLRVTPTAGFTVVDLLIPADYGPYLVDETKHRTNNAQTSRPLRPGYSPVRI
jgi:hypothetical protein